MLRLFRSNSAITIMETIATTLLAFATFSVLARVTGLETVGVWALVASLLSFSRAADFWTRGLASFVGESVGKGESKVAVGFIATSALTGALGYLLIGLVSAPLIHFFANAIVGAENAHVLRSILPLMVGIFWISCMASVYQLGFVGYGRLGWKATLTVMGQILFLLGAVVLAPDLGLRGILYAQAIQGLVVLILSALIFHLHIARTRPDRWWDMARFRQLFNFGSKSLLLAMLVMAIEPSIRLLGSYYGGLAQVAIIEMASRVLAAARALITSLGQVMIPAFARHIGGDKAERAALYEDVLLLFALLGWPATAMVIAASPLVNLVAFGHPTDMLAVYNIVLGLGWLINLISAPAYFLLMGSRHLRPLFISHFVMAAGTFGLGHLGGQLGGVSAAMAGAALGLAVSSAYLVHIIRHEYGITRNSFRSFVPGWKPLLPMLVAIITAYFQLRYLPAPNLIQAIGLIVPTALVALLVTPIKNLSRLTIGIDRR